MNSAFILWQDTAESRMWRAVAKLSKQSNGHYQLSYTKGAMHKSFHGFVGMEDKAKTYISETIFTFLKNRIIAESRPEHDKMFTWLGLNLEQKDYFSLLVLSGGEKRTDYFRLIGVPTIENEMYQVRFFVSGINYLTDKQKKSLTTLTAGDTLEYKLETTNKADRNAVLLLKEQTIGYLPAYLCEEFKQLIDLYGQNTPTITVVQYNNDAPPQYQLLCELSAKIDKNFQPFNGENFQPFH